MVIDRSLEGYQFWRDGKPNRKEWRRLGSQIRELTGGADPDIVFEHPGRETFAASVYVARRGGIIVTCASTTGYDHYFDNRYLWMQLKRIVGSHFANYQEAWRANELIRRGRIHPTLSKTYPLTEAPQAVREVQQNLHQGKIGILCLADRLGTGITDPAMRERYGRDLERFQA
jgi:crotonyl-CoA reductase